MLPRSSAGDPLAEARWSVLKVASVVLLCSFLALIAFLGGWLAGSHSTSQRPASPAAARQGPGPGASRVENGVPVGYQGTSAGAVDAATNFLVVINGPLLLQPDHYRAALRTMSAPGNRQRLLSEAEQGISGIESRYGAVTNAAQGVQVTLRLLPAAWHLDWYHQGRDAQVEIWAAALVAQAGQQPVEVWATAVMALGWTEGDWKLIDHAMNTGPSPSQLAYPADQNSRLQPPPQVTSFQEYRRGA